MARGFSKAVTSQQKQTDSLPSMNILNASFLENFAKLNDPRIERSKEHLLKDISNCSTRGKKGAMNREGLLNSLISS